MFRRYKHVPNIQMETDAGMNTNRETISWDPVRAALWKGFLEILEKHRTNIFYSNAY